MRLLSREESKGTPSVGSKLTSKSKSTTSPIPMASGNELAQLIKIEKM